MSSNEDQMLAELAGRCGDFFKSLSEFCKSYSQNAVSEKEKEPQFKIEKRKKDKTTVDPNLPKKPVTAYLLYFQEKKPNFVQRYPDLTLSALTKLIAKDWNELDGDIKKPYLEKAEFDRQRYEAELGIYKERNRLNMQQKELKQSKQAVKQFKEPKQPKELKDPKQPKKKEKEKEKDKDKEKKKPVSIDIDSEVKSQKNEEREK